MHKDNCQSDVTIRNEGADANHVEGAAANDAHFLDIDLSPRLTSNLEWWFVQGWFGNETIGTNHFMASLFRQRSDGNGRDGFMLLTTIKRDGQSTHTSKCEVSSQFVDNHLEIAGDVFNNIDVDKTMLRCFQQEVRRGGVPSPTVLNIETVKLSKNPFHVRWGEFEMEITEAGLNFRLLLPDGDQIVECLGSPTSTTMKGDAEHFGSMAYECCPRMKLNGTCDGQTMQGEVWLDHQWGDFGWIKSSEEASDLLGWEWFGINLDDGRNIICMSRHLIRNREPIFRKVSYFEPGAPVRFFDDIVLRAGRCWTSPATLSTYPVEWIIEIPTLNAELVFAPLIDDQEIPVFGPINSIWEGAGTVTGTIDGKPVVGRTRLELHGYGYVLDWKKQHEVWINRIDQTLQSFLPKRLDEQALEAFVGKPRWKLDSAAQTQMLTMPVWDLMERGGKHWRPIFGLLLLDVLGQDTRPHEMMISAISELVHNGSVIIDDIEDNSPRRRGDETVHVRYGVPTAINAGNLLYFLPLLTISQNTALSTRQRERIYTIITQMFVKAHMGQAQDIFWSDHQRKRDLSFWTHPDLGSRILQTHAFKSAAAVRAIAEVVCVIANADGKRTEICSKFGESWGVAFQIIDDVKNFSTASEWGKASAEDVAEGKTTYVIYRAISMLSGPDQAQLIRILDDLKLRTTEDGKQAAFDLISKSGAIDVCLDEANALVSSEWPQFASSLPQTQSKIILRVFLEKVLDQPFDM